MSRPPIESMPRKCCIIPILSRLIMPIKSTTTDGTGRLTAVRRHHNSCHYLRGLIPSIRTLMVIKYARHHSETGTRQSPPNPFLSPLQLSMIITPVPPSPVRRHPLTNSMLLAIKDLRWRKRYGKIDIDDVAASCVPYSFSKPVFLQISIS